MLNINLNKQKNDENQEEEVVTADKKPPVISTYNQVKFDIYTIFQEFSKSYGSYKALERIGRGYTKESKHYEKLMTSYALQFHGIVESGWDKTKARMAQYDTLFFGKEAITKHGSIWDRFNRLMFMTHDGGHLFNPTENKYKPYILTKPDFSVCNYAISHFLQFSGITAIEGRFSEEESASGFQEEF